MPLEYIMQLSGSSIVLRVRGGAEGPVVMLTCSYKFTIYF